MAYTSRLKRFATYILMPMLLTLSFSGHPSSALAAATYNFPDLPWTPGQSWIYENAPHCFGCASPLGIDFKAPAGASLNVLAIDTGTVVSVADSTVGNTGIVDKSGNLIGCSSYNNNQVVVDTDGIYVFYSHLVFNSIPPAIHAGAVVQPGQLLGVEGDSGCGSPGWDHLWLGFSYDAGGANPYPMANGTLSFSGWTLQADSTFVRGNQRVQQAQPLVKTAQPPDPGDSYPYGGSGLLTNYGTPPLDNAAYQWQGIQGGAQTNSIMVAQGQTVNYLLTFCNTGNTVWTAPAYAQRWNWNGVNVVSGPALLPGSVPDGNNIAPGQCPSFALTIGPGQVAGTAAFDMQNVHNGVPFGVHFWTAVVTPSS